MKVKIKQTKITLKIQYNIIYNLSIYNINI